MKKIKEIIETVSDLLSISGIARIYFDKDRTWFYHKMNEDVINSVRYGFTDNEVDTLIEAFTNMSKNMCAVAKELEVIRKDRIKQKGKFYTVENPFQYSLFKEWFNKIPQKSKFVEPFAGSCNIPLLLEKEIISDKWVCYDIAPMKVLGKYKVIKRDCIAHFPKGFDAAISNPPYLAKNSATRQKLPYTHTKYDNLYKICLELMLENCQYVAAIIPESFITSNLFHERLYGVVSLNLKCLIVPITQSA